MKFKLWVPQIMHLLEHSHTHSFTSRTSYCNGRIKQLRISWKRKFANCNFNIFRVCLRLQDHRYADMFNSSRPWQVVFQNICSVLGGNTTETITLVWSKAGRADVTRNRTNIYQAIRAAEQRRQFEAYLLTLQTYPLKIQDEVHDSKNFMFQLGISE